MHLNKLSWVLLILAALLLLLFLAAPHLMFNFIFGRPSRSKKIPKYYIGTPHYIVSQEGLKYMKERPNEEVTITSRDGLKLHAYLFPADEESNKFVIGVHGYRSYSRPECAPYVEFYHSLGYNMLMVDDRAHAPSEGEHIGFGVLDRLDVVDWANYLVSTYGEDTEILMHGVSMGGATVVSASGEPELPAQVKGIVADCAFSHPYEVLEHQLGQMHLPAGMMLPRIEKLCEKKIGIDLHSITAIGQVQKAQVPMLFVQGGKDEMVPPYMAEDLYNACSSEHKKLLQVPEAGHGESIAFAPEEYHQAIIDLFGIEAPAEN